MQLRHLENAYERRFADEEHRKAAVEAMAESDDTVLVCTGGRGSPSSF